MVGTAASTLPVSGYVEVSTPRALTSCQVDGEIFSESGSVWLSWRSVENVPVEIIARNGNCQMFLLKLQRALR